MSSDCLNGSHNNNRCNDCHSLDSGQESRVPPTQTYNFKFQCYRFNQLPGRYIVSHNCHADCWKIKANVERIAQFCSGRFRYALDSYIASINVVDRTDNGRIWKNAGWHPKEKQVLFGQRYIHEDNGSDHLLSYGRDITIVAHEFCHGLIQKTKESLIAKKYLIATAKKNNDPNLYENDPILYEALALEESLCDIFAILFCNYNQTTQKWKRSIINWQWEVGKNISIQDTRNLKSPLVNLSIFLREGKKINSHSYSLIHSHAFYKFITAKRNNVYLFDGKFALELFEATLENIYLFDASFLGSRKAFESSARTLLRNKPLQEIKIRLQAISQAFDDVGISLPD